MRARATYDLLVKNFQARRAILVTGKGGVGKTTVSAALARHFARQGKRVVAAEMAKEGDEASPLGDALGVARLSETPVPVDMNLSAMLLTPTVGHQKFLRDVLPMKLLADAAMRSGAIRRFLSAAPTFPEMGVLYRLLDLVRAKRRDGTDEHEVIVVDLPATGHALALAQIPASLLRVIPTGPIAEAVREGLAFLRDASRTGAVVVTLPETLPVSEAIELVQGIRDNEIPIASVVVNRVPFDPFTPEEREAVRRMLDGFPPTLGERTVERIDRARVAIARLAREVSVPVTILHDVWLEGPRLTEEVASLMQLEATTR